MTKIKHLLLLACIAGCFTACKIDNGPVDNFDYEAQFKTDTAAISKFIKEKNIPAVKHESGIFYQILEPGTGTAPTLNSTVTADYEGRLLDGSVFDSSKLQGGAIDFPLNGVIQGWQIGIPLIKKGGKIRLIIPSLYGYRNQAQGSIPPNSILDFTVTLNNVR